MVSLENTPKVSKFGKIALVLYAIVSLMFNPLATMDGVYAAGDRDAWEKAGINADASIEDSSIYDDLDSIVYFIMAIGGFWVIGCLIFAGMRLSGAQGNPQARTQGFIGLAMACVGLFVIVQAYDIAGWVAGFGNN